MDLELDLSDGWAFIYYYLKCLALVPFSIRDKKISRIHLTAKLFALVLIVLHCCVIVYENTCHPYEQQALTLTNVELIIAKVDEMLQDITTVLIISTTALQSSSILDIVGKLWTFANDRRYYGPDNTIREVRRKFIRSIGTVTAVYLTARIVGHLASKAATTYDIVGSIDHSVATVIRISACVIFGHVLLHVRYQFDFVNDQLRECLQPPSPVITDVGRSTLSELYVIDENGEHGRTKVDANEDFPPRESATERIFRISKWHVRLCNVVEDINALSNLMIVTTFASYICQFVSSTRYLIAQANRYSLNEFKLTNWLHIFSIICEVLIAWYQIWWVSYAAASMSRAANETKLVLHRGWNAAIDDIIDDVEGDKFKAKRAAQLWKERRPENLRREAFVFSLHLAHHPVSISAGDVVTLDFSFPVKMFCTVVAYIVIFVQLDSSTIVTS